MAASGVVENGAAKPLSFTVEKSGERLGRFLPETKNEVRRG